MIRLALLLVLFSASTSARSLDTSYPLTVTVVSSHVNILCSPGCVYYLGIHALVNGRHLEMQSEKPTWLRLLVLGDYKAKLVSDEHKKPYFFQQAYEFQYPDGATEKFSVIGESK